MTSHSKSGGMSRRSWLKFSGLGSAGLLAAGRAAADENPGFEKPVNGGKPVKGVIFMVSDGMSPGVLTLAEAYSRMARGRGTRWYELYNDSTTARGLMATASANSLVTDSAAAASAWGGGQHVNNGAINVSVDGREITPIAAHLKRASKARIGLVTTSSVTHATPAGFAASVSHRDDEVSIAPQYLDRVDVVLGGGSKFFDSAKRPDKHDVHNDYAKAGYHCVQNRGELLASREKRLLGTFAPGHLPFSIDRDHDTDLAAKVPTLKEMAVAALSRFLAGNKPFLLQIEGARIDHAAHLNDGAGLLGEQLAFDDTLAAVLPMVANRDDILVVVTSDHGNSNPGLTGMGTAYTESTRCFERIRNMKASHEKVLEDWKRSGSRDPGHLSLLVENQLGFVLADDESEALAEILRSKQVIEWNHQLKKPEGLLGQFAGNHTGIGWTGTTHTTDPTLISAIGPQAQRFSGIVENTNVFDHLMDLLG